MLAELYGNSKMCVVSGATTWEIFGRRINAALGAAAAEPIVLNNAKADLATVERVAAATSAPVLIAAGSGAITDIVKYATFRTGRRFSVFASSPMNAYSTSSASILVDGVKKSVPSHCADGLFFELKTLAACPPRLLASAFADLLCRSCIQIDWLLAGDFAGADYRAFPFHLAECDEADLIAAAGNLTSGDHQSIAILVRACIANGLGSLLLKSTACNSRCEHLISHYLDMFAGDAHPGSLHGEQVGVATLAMMRLQEQILQADQPPQLHASADRGTQLIARYGKRLGSVFAQNCTTKAISAPAAAQWNRRWQDDWDTWRSRLRKVMLPAAKAEQALRACGGSTSASQLGFDPEFFRRAVRDAMYLRNRFGILDLAASARMLEQFASRLQ
ncbi:MAG: iron-containing alcohol dehydrogenase [Betaproteobacteria bacterium]|nr:iron-containing alcohol dehydrogenase [Betaproteobacteria bacterium]